MKGNKNMKEYQASWPARTDEPAEQAERGQAASPLGKQYDCALLGQQSTPPARLGTTAILTP